MITNLESKSMLMKMSHEEQRKCAGADAVEQQDITGEPVEL